MKRITAVIPGWSPGFFIFDCISPDFCSCKKKVCLSFVKNTPFSVPLIKSGGFGGYIFFVALWWRRRRDSNSRAVAGKLISSFIAVCYLHGFSCQFQSALYARKPAWNLDFLKKSPENTEKSPIGSNQRFFRFWKELRKERKEQNKDGIDTRDKANITISRKGKTAKSW